MSDYEWNCIRFFSWPFLYTTNSYWRVLKLSMNILLKGKIRKIIHFVLWFIKEGCKQYVRQMLYISFMFYIDTGWSINNKYTLQQIMILIEIQKNPSKLYGRHIQVYSICWKLVEMVGYCWFLQPNHEFDRSPKRLGKCIRESIY